MIFKSSLCLALAAMASLATADVTPAAVESTGSARLKELKATVDYLASEELEGRMTGSDGAKKAAAYLIKGLEKAGINPGGDDGTFLHKFEFSAGVKVNPDNRLEIETTTGSSELKASEDFLPLAFTENAEVSAPVVFAGYGLKVPGKESDGYNSYATIDVKDKIALVLRYVPEDVTPDRRGELNHYAGLHYKAMLAREQGAKGLLVVTGPNSPGAGELIPITSDSGGAGSQIPAMTITLETAEKLMQSAGKDLKEIQSQLDKENPHADTGFTIEGTTVTMASSVERLRAPDNNVIGILPPTGGMKEYVLIGAHYDHLGHGDKGSLHRKGEENSIHYGADDNASGAAVVLNMAQSLAEQRITEQDKPARGIIFAFWSGEEIGVIGSSRFAEKPTVPLADIVTYLNFDMVGRLRENKLSVQGTGSSKGWKKLLEKRNVAAGFNLSIQEDPYLPTDTSSFYPKQIPVMNFFTGSHEDYHRPTDTADKINFEGLERVTDFARALARDIATAGERPDYVKVERPAGGSGGGRDALRVYVGSIPDYATEGPGVKLSGTRAGSPADKAGLQGGDIIVEFAGQKIANIYDYTYALDAAKIGKEIKVVVKRKNETVTLKLTPEARK